MEVTNIKTLYLTKEELKEAIEKYLVLNDKWLLAEHLRKNTCDMVWTRGEKKFMVSIDGETEDKSGF